MNLGNWREPARLWHPPPPSRTETILGHLVYLNGSSSGIPVGSKQPSLEKKDGEAHQGRGGRGGEESLAEWLSGRNPGDRQTGLLRDMCWEGLRRRVSLAHPRSRGGGGAVVYRNESLLQPSASPVKSVNRLENSSAGPSSGTRAEWPLNRPNSSSQQQPPSPQLYTAKVPSVVVCFRWGALHRERPRRSRMCLARR
ncbi:hypothetical protein LX36DRAFT_649411 [Colletotrichum falcatum]|nr:hypothetical protein LX36DRAFT_649411 [Colletotrichum falcatum]